jgi:hypothetical protein
MSPDAMGDPPDIDPYTYAIELPPREIGKSRPVSGSRPKGIKDRPLVSG